MRQLNQSRLIVMSAMLLLMNSIAAFAQSSGGSYSLTSHVVAGGGCGPDGSGGCTQSLGSGNLSVTGTAAEAGASPLSNQPPYSERGGFWYATLANTPTASPSSISGRITTTAGFAVSGAVINLTGTQTRKTITDAEGNYRFDNIGATDFCTVTPARVNFSFAPAQRSFSQVGNHNDAAFIAESNGAAANPLDTAEYFVRQQYVDILGREPDEGGFNYWSDQILSCGTDAQCVSTRRREVAAAFFIEQEFQLTGSFIYDVYAGALGRRPVFAEYANDRLQVIGGINLAAAKSAFALRFVQRADFVAKYQANTAADSFVDALLENARQSTSTAGVDLASERDQLVARYQSGVSQNESRAFVISDLADNATFKQAQYNSAFVLTEYFGYLRRDIDERGFDFWVNVLNNSGRNYRGMICSFVTSTEYQQRFGSVASRTNGECGP